MVKASYFVEDEAGISEN